MPRINLARKGIRDDRCPDAIKSFGGLSRRGWIGAEAQQRAPDCDQEKPASHRFTPTVMPAQFYAAEYTGMLSEERVRRAGRPSLFHVNNSRLQFKFGKAEAKLLREHIAKRVDAAYCSAIHLARWKSYIKAGIE